MPYTYQYSGSHGTNSSTEMAMILKEKRYIIWDMFTIPIFIIQEYKLQKDKTGKIFLAAIRQ